MSLLLLLPLKYRSNDFIRICVCRGTWDWFSIQKKIFIFPFSLFVIQNASKIKIVLWTRRKTDHIIWLNLLIIICVLLFRTMNREMWATNQIYRKSNSIRLKRIRRIGWKELIFFGKPTTMQHMKFAVIIIKIGNWFESYGSKSYYNSTCLGFDCD